MKIFTIFACFIALFASACGFSTQGGQVSDKADNSCALYIYMCGSTLETRNGAATKNLEELLSSKLPDNMKVIVQTGGAKKWRKYDIASDKISRYQLKDGQLELLETTENSCMGDSSTLSEFLEYCTGKHPAARAGLIIWDHGTGSVNGVCGDENFNMKGLSSKDIKEALGKTNYSFDFIGFDACLMANLDTMEALSGNAKYLIASEEIESTEGWDYASLIKDYTSSADMKEVCSSICKSYMDKCKANNKDSIATISAIDLGQADQLIKGFNNLFTAINKADDLMISDVAAAALDSVFLGGNCSEEGYSNTIDLYEFSKSLTEKTASAKELCQAVDKAIICNLKGTRRSDVSGISFFYPLVEYDKDLNKYLDICNLDSYKNYLKENYSEIPKDTIKFIDKGSMDEAGRFVIQLEADSVKYYSRISFYLMEYQTLPGKYDMGKYLGLGADNDIYYDKENHRFVSNFRGQWITLNGSYLYYTVVDEDEDYVIFSAPVIVNEKRTNLRFSFTFDSSYDNGGYYSVIGLWDGIEEDGTPSKEIRPLKEGDRLTILGKEYEETASENGMVEKEVITIGAEGANIYEMPLKEKTYQYVFIITDIYGVDYYSDTAVFNMLYTYEELKEKKLSDMEPAAKVTLISSDVDNEAVYGNVG